MEVREKWVEMMNAAMERHGHIQDPAQRLDARSWADQGRHDLAELRGAEVASPADEAQRRWSLACRDDGWAAGATGRAASASLEPRDKVMEHWEQQSRTADRPGAGAGRARELSRLDKLIAAARELAHEVKDRTFAFAKDVKERAGSLFGR